MKSFHPILEFVHFFRDLKDRLIRIEERVEGLARRDHVPPVQLPLEEPPAPK